MYTINLPNRDNANLMLISEDEKTWTFKVDENHNYTEYVNNFNCDADGAIEILYSINLSNINLINDI